MATKRRSSVPHHRVDRALYDQAKVVAESAGWSMSRVASWGLEEYLSDLSPSEYDELVARATAAGPPKNRKQSLPVEVSQQILTLWNSRSDRCNAYFAAVYEQGWSLRTIADVVGISRQSVYQRVAKQDDTPSVEGLTPIPAAPFIPAAPLREKADDPSESPVDWPLWVDADLHAAASQRARDERRPMYEVMENILEAFVREFSD